MKLGASIAISCLLLFIVFGFKIAEPVIKSNYKPEQSTKSAIADIEEALPPMETGAPELRRISREESGLDYIPYISLDGLEINPTILEAYKHHLNMDYPEYFPDEYYQQGLEVPINHYSDALIISSRWEGFIIADISIGSSRDELTGLLGDPSQTKETDSAWRYYYKTKQYYMLFEGDNSTNKIQCVVLSPSFPMSEQYSDAIEQTIGIFNRNKGNAHKALQELDEYSFFGGAEIRNGGVFAADSPYGVSVLDFDSVIIHNNFDGMLYQYHGEHNGPEIKYLNYDPYIEIITYTLDEYHNTHNLDYYDYASYDGRYYIHHEFVNSQAQYIWVYDRTLQKNPYRVWAQRIDFGGGYGWLDKSYTIFCYDGLFDEMLLIDISEELPRHYTADDELASEIRNRYNLVGTK